MTETNPESAPRSGRTTRATKPFSIRLTDDERATLLTRAGRVPLGTFIRDVLLDGKAQAKRRRSLSPVKDHEALARVLALLGASRIASNLNQLAKAANTGVLPIGPEADADLREACAAVVALRAALMKALGLQRGGSA